MPSEACRLTRDAFHSATITKESVRMIVDEVKSWLVEGRSSLCLGDGEADSIGEPLTQRARGDFNACGIERFRMARGDAVDLLKGQIRILCLASLTGTYSERLQIVYRHIIAEKMEQRIL